MAETFGTTGFAIEQILTDDDPRVADYRAIGEPELLRSRNLFVAEGRFVVARLLADPRWKIRSLLVSDAAARQLVAERSRLPAGVPVFLTAARNFQGITGYHIHRGCLALVERPPVVGLEQLVETIRVAVVLEAVTNADNVGGVFRNAAAFGADAVMLSPRCCSPLYRKAVRTSMGATLQVPFVHFESWPAPLSVLRASGFTLVALTATTGGASFTTLEAFASSSVPVRLALLVGSEGAGLTPVAASAADVCVHIPMRQGVDSLNLAVATGIALEQLTRGARGRGILPGRTDPQT
jgi:tRNA G18 (ribose-2'-O)-methylase SpoU